MEDIERQDQMLRRRSYELGILNEIARTLNASVDLPALLTRALEKVVELLGLHTGWVLLFDEDTGEPQLAASQNLPPGFQQEPERLTGWCYCLESFHAGHLDGAANISVVTCSRLRKLALAQGDTANLRCHASIPLTVCINDVVPVGEGIENRDGCPTLKRLGMLNVASPEWRQFTRDELNLLRTIGDIVGVAIERVRLHARRLEAVQTEERNRIAREIHDTIAQDLSAVAFQLEAAEALLDQHADPERIRRNIGSALDLTRKGLEEARRSVLDLRAAPLEGRTLPEALAALARETDDVRAPAVTFSLTSEAHPLSPAIEVGLYRIAREALQNTLHHAGAAHVTIWLDISPEKARLIVEDDGHGFDVSALAEGREGGRFGLVGMRERVRLLGGFLHIESTPGTGTRITAEVPLTPQSTQHHA